MLHRTLSSVQATWQGTSQRLSLVVTLPVLLRCLLPRRYSERTPAAAAKASA